MTGPALVHFCELRSWGHGEGKAIVFWSDELWKAEPRGKRDIMGKLVISLLRVNLLVLVDPAFIGFKSETSASWESPQFPANWDC